MTTAVLAPATVGAGTLRRWARWTPLAGVGVVWPFVGGAVLGEVGATYAVQVVIAVIAVAGLHVLVHWSSQVSLAHAALLGVGAFVTARANADAGLPLPLAILTGVAGAVVVSLFLGVPALRIKGFALALVTLAFGVAASRWLFVQHWLVPQVSGLPLRSQTMLGLDVTRSRALILPYGLLATGVVLATALIGNSALGRRMRMSAHDEEVAASYGIDVAAHKLFAFVFAGGCAGLAGALTDVSIGRVGPGAFTSQRSVLLLSAVLLGGAGSVAGSVLAAASFTLLPLVPGAGRYLDLIAPLSILLIVTVSPAGINGLTRTARRVGRGVGHRSDASPGERR
jgi:ABC-type branched-subunit amino acid transport system permease subunit